jgi:uroporphyrinogen III methyltransferase/synthase
MSHERAQRLRGICWLIGAGPGDPGLLTLKGKECLESADVVVYDYLCNPELLKWSAPHAERIYVGKKAGHHTLPQEEVNRLLIEKTQAGLRVARLKGGDPFVFGRGGEEAEELRAAGLDYEIVPGISSAIAGPAYAGIPITHRDLASQFTVFTGHEDPSREESALDYEMLARSPGTKVFLMGVERLAAISEKLMEEGAAPETPVALVRWATTARQETLVSTLGKIATDVQSSGFKAPAVGIIGDVVSLREHLTWFEKKPLHGKRIVVTRTRKQAGALSRALQGLGADVVELPTIRIEPTSKPKVFQELVRDAHRYDWVVFTSPNGVDAFFQQFYQEYDDLREIGGVRIAAIGPGTAARVRRHRLKVDLVRAEETRDVLPAGLTNMGAIVDEAPAYRTVPETEDPTGAVARIQSEGADMITFTSSSTAKHFGALNVGWPQGASGASIGPVTSETMRELGFPIDVEAATFDIPGLVDAIVNFFRKS